MAPLELLRLLLDVDRLAVAGLLAARPSSVEQLVLASGRDRRVVLAALGDLRGAGLVMVDGGQYRLDLDSLRIAAKTAAEVDVPMDPTIGFGMTEQEQAILARMFAGRTLVEIPSSRAKRQVLLQRLALEFEVGRHYSEREVNAILFTFHPDWSALRRQLVDEGYLDRANTEAGNEYWRSGGRVV